MTATAAAPPGLPGRIWLVSLPEGERHFVVREPLEGMAAWAEGVDATVAEYRFAAVVHVPPPKTPAPKVG